MNVHILSIDLVCRLESGGQIAAIEQFLVLSLEQGIAIFSSVKPSFNLEATYNIKLLQKAAQCVQLTPHLFRKE